MGGWPQLTGGYPPAYGRVPPSLWAVTPRLMGGCPPGLWALFLMPQPARGVGHAKDGNARERGERTCLGGSARHEIGRLCLREASEVRNRGRKWPWKQWVWWRDIVTSTSRHHIATARRRT